MSEVSYDHQHQWKCETCDARMSDAPKPPRKVMVHFDGGPWRGQTYETERVVGPVFAVGHEIGNHYWLDGKSDPPTYIWRGSEVIFPYRFDQSGGQSGGAKGDGT